jgi:hypothetical protein
MVRSLFHDSCKFFELHYFWLFPPEIRTCGTSILIFFKRTRTGTRGYWQNQILHNMLLAPWLLMSCGWLGEDYSVASNEGVNGKWVLEGLVWTVQIDLVLAQNCVFFVFALSVSANNAAFQFTTSEHMSGSVSISLNHNSDNPFYQISSKMKIIVFVLKLESTQFPQRC